MSRNLLDQETSPYLLQHADNPVHWRPWGEAALGEAAEQNKPILLSIGYAACHWCHVMAHESFENEAIAEAINRDFIPIKIDREERPDIDHIYQTALAILGGRGGWPLTMFLRPDGAPFWGGTYFPPTPRFGLPSFAQILSSLADAYIEKAHDVTVSGDRLTELIAQNLSPIDGSLPPADLPRETADRLIRQVDFTWGGLNGAPKFPHMPLFTLLWRDSRRGGDPAGAEAVRTTLDRMSQGGIYDHLAGGYARYATDEEWLVPHFEKMLYDNADLIRLLTLVWQADKNPLYAARVAETISWLQAEMMAAEGGFAATLDADSEGEEGKYYVWTADQIDTLLSPDAARKFKTVYGVTPGGNWEGKTILNRNHPAGAFDAAHDAELQESRAVLLKTRRQRIPPGRDDKLMADWNGMMIVALAEAAFAFRRADWSTLAEQVFGAVVTHLGGDDHRLSHSTRLGKKQAEAMLDDYAQMIAASLTLLQVTGKTGYLTQALAWLALVDRHYASREGGYFFTADDAKHLLVRAKTGLDQATPSGNGVMLENFARLFHLTGDDSYRQRAENLMTIFGGDLMRNPTGAPTLLNGWDLLNNAVQLVLIGDPGDPARQAMLTAIAETCLPTRLLTQLTQDQPLPPGHPAAGKQAAAGKTTLFICKGPVCDAPITDPALLRDALARL